MALDVYFREDVQNILRATLVASEGSASLLAICSRTQTSTKQSPHN